MNSPGVSWLSTVSRWLGPIRTATGGLRRHKVQAVALGMVVLISTASATLGLALLAASNSPFQHAFASQHGADATLTVNPDRASPVQLAATRKLPGVTATAGPFAAVTVPAQSDGQPFGQLTLAGRPSAGGPVDDVVLNAGHWPDGLGQVVLDGVKGAGPGGKGQLGSKLTVTGAAGRVPAGTSAGDRTLTVVGFANSVTDTADGWVSAGEATRLQALGGTASTQLMYRFTRAGSYAQVRADIAELTRALPSGAVTGAATWLGAEANSTSNGSIMEPFVIAFALIGLIMAVLIVGNVISGAVVAQYHRIGVLKSLGLTPAQLAMAYLSRVGWPALAGALIGVVVGSVLAAPVLQQSAGAYGVGHQGVPGWAMLAAPAGILAITALAALGPSLRAGRLSAVQAIAAGRAPRSGRGYAVHRLTARLRLPRPVALGLAAPFARPARAAVTLASIAFGATAVIFAFGLTASLNRAAQDSNLTATVPVQVQPFGPGQGSGPGSGPSAAQDAAVSAALRAQPGTAHEVAVYGNQVSVPGLGSNVYAQGFGGDAAWTGYALISGHWYSAPGEIDVNTAFLTQSGLQVGSPVTVNTGTAQVTVRIAGEVFQPSSQPQLLAATQTLPGLGTAANLQQYDVGLRPGTTAASYTQAVNGVLGSRSPWQATPAQTGQFYTVAISLVGLLALMVAAAAGLGVLNTVLMTTRDRVHDLGVFKALGMRPGQLLTMVVCWVAGPAVLAGLIAAPAAVVLNSATVHAMAGTAHTGVPADLTAVFPPARLALLSLAALVIAVAGALLPASWAARARPAVALRTE
jgi:putative ABC transport system permease protein